MPLSASQQSAPRLLAEVRPRVALVVSDREWAARALESALVADGYAALRAETAEQAVAVCAAANPDVVFVEQRLAGRIPGRALGDGTAEPAGLTLCRTLRRLTIVSEATPVVVTTADTPSRSDLLDALGAGAWDLCALPIDEAALLARCGNWVRAKRHAERALEAGLTDADTGLYNLRGLTRRTREVIDVARRAELETSLACVAFRADAIDSATGRRGSVDELASADRSSAGLARRVRDACVAVGRASDVFARVGPREFAVLAPATSEEGVGRLVDRLGRTLAAGVVLLGDQRQRGRSMATDVADVLDEAVLLGPFATTSATQVGSADEAVDVVIRAITELTPGR